MTAFDRIERRMPEVFDDLAAARVPDYFDDMLRQTARTRQRPAWSTLERWLPMGVIARPVPLRPIPWRAIVVAAVVISLVVTAALAYVGSRQRRVPPPFGLAANGALVIATADGDIVTVDPATGKTTPLIGGPTIDGGPYFSNDGLRLVFDRGATDATKALWIANADGTDAREITREPNIFGFEWLPDGNRAAIVATVAGKGELSTLDLTNGTRTHLPLDLDVRSASWRPNHEQFIVTAAGTDTPVTHVTFWVVDSDGSGTPRKIDAAPNAINDPTISSDGRLLAYSTWDPARIHVVDIDAGDDHPITTGNDEGSVWQSPHFSPDGAHIVVNRFLVGGDPIIARLNIIPADGREAPIMVGPASENPQPDVLFSPDGTSLLATYSNPKINKTYLFDTATGSGHEVPFLAINGSSWQRTAP